MKTDRAHYKRFLLGLVLLLLPQPPLQAKEPIPTPTVLEQQLKTIDSELNQLAHYTMRTGVGNLGWLSDDHPTPKHSEWIEIRLKQEAMINQIALAPIIWMDENRGPIADGFPVAFRIIAGSKEHPEGRIIATQTAHEKTLPRIAPLVIPLPSTPATWVRIEATQLSSWAWHKERYIFQLSEVLIFSGDQNIALRRPVRTSTHRKNKVTGAMAARALTDGYMPYLMDAATGPRSDPYIIFYRVDQIPVLTIDLGKKQLIDRITLHAPDLRENIPHIHHADYGIPKHLLIETSLTPDFSNAVSVVEYKRNRIYEAGPIITRNVAPTPARYVRLTVKEGYQAPEADGSWRCVGFAEIEVCSNTTNLALGQTAVLNIKETDVSDGHITALTDGLNHYGSILTTRDWVNQLARRHELETQRPIISDQLAQSYLRQEQRMRWLKILVSLLVIVTALGMGLEDLLHRRQVRNLKEQFAADLHDEIGANLHTIGLLSDLVEEFKQAPHHISDYVQRIRAVTERTGMAVRYVTGVHESPELFSDLKTDMQRAAGRIVTKQHHTLTIDGESYIPLLKQRTRINLFLFFKECLINISRHSGATELKTELTLTSKEITLSITDNGKGLTQHIPKSLRRRARLCRAQIRMETPATGGTRIILQLRSPRNIKLNH